MKYNHLLLMILFFLSNIIHFNVLASEPQSSLFLTQHFVIRPSTVGPRSVVDAIREYSNITPYDVYKWKLVKLGGLDYWVALGLGVFSMGLAADAASKSFQYVSEKVPKFISDTITLPDVLKKQETWRFTSGAGAGLLSYNILYTRIRAGMLNKVQNFIKVCSGLIIANYHSSQSTDMRSLFPAEWNTGGEAALCLALNDLVVQSQQATALLNQIGDDDPQVSRMRSEVNKYREYLEYNQKQFMQYCNQLDYREQAQEDRELRRASMKAQVFGQQLQNVNTTLSIIKKIGNFLYRGAKDMVSWTVDNPAPAGLLGMAYYFWKTNVPQKTDAATEK